MMARALAFIKYHNALPIGLSFFLLSVSGALAASPELRNDLSKGVVSATESLIAIDNSYIASVDLETYTPRIEIKNVTEDETSYYVEYVLTTIDLADGVWRDVGKEETMNVAKDALGGKDLGLYVTRQLAEVSDAEMERLRGTQQFERQNGVTQKTVATAYSGLIGKYLDPKEEVLPGYMPVIPEPEPAPTEPAAAVAGSSLRTAPGVVTSRVAPSASGDTVPPGITILGNSTSRITLHSTYIDLGVVVADNIDRDLEASATLDGVAVPAISSISIDTGTTSTHSIVYTAADRAGNSSSVIRIVVVYDPFAPDVPSSSSEGGIQNEPAEPTAEVVPSSETDPTPSASTALEENATATSTFVGVDEESAAGIESANATSTPEAVAPEPATEEGSDAAATTTPSQ